MKKEKEWLKKETEKLYKHDEAYLNPDDIVVENYQTVTSILELIDQLDEPEKVVIPEWFADFIEERLESTSDGDLVMDLWLVYYHGDFAAEHFSWLRNNKELATRAILDGYTIEKPKLLTVTVKDCDKTIMTKQLPEDEVNKMMEGLG